MRERKEIRAKALELAIALIDAVPDLDFPAELWVPQAKARMIGPDLIEGIADRMIRYIEG